MRRAVLLLMVLAWSGCRGVLAGELFSKTSVAYRIEAPPESEGWRRVDFADNDLAWLHKGGQVMAVNATCSDHDDPPLDVLTRHLVMGFTDRDWVDQRAFTLDGRDALRSTWLTLVVVKKNGCVHDFTYISPDGREGEQAQRFEALVAGFQQERRR